MFLALLLSGIGILLSAFFSGSETGFYRVTRVRLATDAKSGRPIARALHWLVSRSSLVVATVLIGNNIANYLVSFGLILLSQNLFSQPSRIEALLPVLMTPVLFIYGELLPKYFYYQLPYQLLQRSAPLLLLCTLLFAPISIVVILLESAWRRITGTTTGKAASSLERQELQRVLIEGQEAGVVLPIQREIAQNLFTYGVRPIRQFATPLRALPVVSRSASTDEILQLADKSGQPIIGLVEEGTAGLVGCFLSGDLLVTRPDRPTVVPVCKAKANESNIQVLTRLQSQHSPIVQVADAAGKIIGVVTRERLTALLLSEK